jgi:tyrosinase
MLHRRAFMLAGGSSLATLAAPSLIGAQGAVVTRRSVRGMAANDPDLVAMRRAVAAMKALPQSDARNWIRFADIHRNFCPHGNWYFLPWHRAYIASFERVCRQLSGRRNFALPYWDWTADRQFPAVFAAGDRRTNPLFHPRPGVANGLRLADDMVGQGVISRVLNSPDFEAFGSTRPRGQDSADARWQRRLGSKTELEFNPHDGVHGAIGGNMGVVDLSSRDPIFYLHHANIDRIWNGWNRRGHANSNDPMWRDFAFNGNFYNGDGSRWNVAVGNLGATGALGYRYDDDEGPFAADLVRATGDLMTDKLSAYRRLDPRMLAGSARDCAASRCRPAAPFRWRWPRTSRSLRTIARSASPCHSAVRSARSSVPRRSPTAPIGRTPANIAAMSGRCCATSRRRLMPPPACGCSATAMSFRREPGWTIQATPPA